jgi:hypothetical protein
MAMSSQLSGQALLDDLSKRAVKFFWEQSNPVTGLTKDRASNFASPDTHNVASIAATGYALAAYAIGAHRGWLDRKLAIDRTKVTLDFLLTKALKDHGWYVHFVDWSNGSRVWNSEVSSIDTSIMVAGAIVNEEEFNDKEITAKTDQIIKNIDWKWLLDDGGETPNSLLLSMGFGAEQKFIKSRWDQLSEELMLYVQGLGASPDLTYASWVSIGRPIITYDGRQEVQGGPLFMHEMSQEFLPLYGKRDGIGFDYSVESRNAILNDRAYCIANPHHFTGYTQNIWGLNASDYPGGYTAHGGPGWGDDDGTLTPTCAIASVQYTPEVGMASANAFMEQYPKAYGVYGFSNAINPGAKWIDPDVIGIDLGMMLLGIENARDGLPNNLSWKNAVIRKGFERAKFHSDESEGPFDKRLLVN